MTWCLSCSEGPKTEHNIQVQSHQGWVQRDDHFPALLAALLLIQARMPFSATWGHCWLTFSQVLTNTPRSISSAQSSSYSAQACSVAGVVVAEVQDPAFGPAELHPTGLSPASQPVQIPLEGLPSPRQTHASSQLGVICKFSEGALHAFIRVISKDTGQAPVPAPGEHHSWPVSSWI